jgi:hypothetical protein
MPQTADRNELDLNRLDVGIRKAVQILREMGIDTFESCEGGNDHAFGEPTIRFNGDRVEGLRALTNAMAQGLKVSELRRVWSVQDGEVNGPWWVLTFTPTKGE